MKALFRSYELDTAILTIGNYIEDNGFYMINDKHDYNRPVVRHYIQDSSGIKHEVAPEYLAIHFTNSGMEDSEKTPIFASLSSDGNGGDNTMFGDKQFTYIFKNTMVSLISVDNYKLLCTYSESKVTGIHTIEVEG